MLSEPTPPPASPERLHHRRPEVRPPSSAAATSPRSSSSGFSNYSVLTACVVAASAIAAAVAVALVSFGPLVLPAPSIFRPLLSATALIAAERRVTTTQQQQHQQHQKTEDIKMAWRSSGSSNVGLVENLARNGLIKSQRVKAAMLAVRTIAHQQTGEKND